MTKTRTPILPAHVEATVQAIAEVHLQHHRDASTLQRTVDRMTSAVARPGFVLVMTIVIVLWIVLNLGLMATGRPAFDAAPFPWLQDLGTGLALYITVLILITQRRENLLAEKREQLTLELAILSERKAAKLIQLIEELRRDLPDAKDRVDQEAAEMSRPADPQAALDAIDETHELGEADEQN